SLLLGAFRPGQCAPPSSPPLPSLGRKLFCEAQASISVPSTEKCSSDNSGLTCGWFKSLVMNLANTSPFCSRSRFLVNTVGSHTFVGRKSHEPAVQKIVVQLLHQLAFRPDAVEHLQQQGAQQLLRRDRRTAFARVKPRKATVQLAQHIAHKVPDLPQRMVRRHPRLRRNVRKQPTMIRKYPPHASLRRFAIEKTESANPRYGEGFFSKLLDWKPSESSLRLSVPILLSICDNTSEKLRQVLAGLQEARGGRVKMTDEEMFHDVVSGSYHLARAARVA